MTLMSSQENTVNQSAIHKSLRLAFGYTILIVIGFFWFFEPISSKWNVFLEHATEKINLSFFMLMMFSFSCCHIVNAFSWMILIQSRDQFQFIANLKATSVYSMLINILPIGTGHLLGVWFFHKFLKCSSKRLLYAWSLDQYIRGLVKVTSIILFLTFVEPFGEIGDQMRTALAYFGGLIFLGAVGLVIFRHSQRIVTFCEKLLSKLGIKDDHIFETNWLKTFFKAVCLRFLCWFFECFPVWILCFGLVESFSLEMVLALFLSVKMATAYSISPGNFGVHEGVAYFVAKAYGVDEATSLTIGVLYHLGFWLPTIIPGMLILIYSFFTGKVIKYKNAL